MNFIVNDCTMCIIKIITNCLQSNCIATYAIGKPIAGYMMSKMTEFIGMVLYRVFHGLALLTYGLTKLGFNAYITMAMAVLIPYFVFAYT